MRNKFVFFSAAALIVLIACHNSGRISSAKVEHPDIEKGLNLVAKSDCFACHKISDASIGPAYNKIGEKYENNDANIVFLAAKIQKGGSGNWGTVPMPGHTRISKGDASLMAKYVLSLKNVK
jgi:cytochrome c